MKRLGLVCIRYAGMNFEGYRGCVLRGRAGSPYSLGFPALERVLEGGKITAKEIQHGNQISISDPGKMGSRHSRPDREIQPYHPQGEGVPPSVECTVLGGLSGLTQGLL